MNKSEHIKALIKQVNEYQKWIERFSGLGNEDANETPEIIFNSVVERIDTLESENQKLKDKLDHRTSEFDIAKKELDELERKHLSVTSMMYDDIQRYNTKIIELEQERDANNKELYKVCGEVVELKSKLAEVEKLIKLCESEGTSIIYVYELKKALRIGDKP